MKRAAVISGLLVLVAGVAGVLWLKPRLEDANRKLHEARVGRAKLDILAIERAVEDYQFTNGGDWRKAVTALSEGASPRFERDKLLDPWGRPYQFKTEGAGEQERFVVWSQGADPSDETGFVYSPRVRP